MMDLFESTDSAQLVGENAPLATRMRPQTLSDFVGQSHILSEGNLLLRQIQADRVSSLIFYGPPGVGKTSLAEVIAQTTQKKFSPINAVTSSVAELRTKIEEAKNRLQTTQQQTILFVDEIHRFNKAQQDVLLPHVESGVIAFIGATTHNPFFYINSTLLSRSQIFELNPLNETEIKEILRRALQDKERGLGQLRIDANEEALAHLAKVSDGDARKALNALEVGAKTTPKNNQGKIVFNLQTAEESIQKKQVLYDQNEDAHYDTASAFIKSMRGGDPDAAIYWVAKMLYAGEDPRFIARRLVIAASEDVGNADPRALLMATAALKAIEFVGMPEARIPLAQAVIYVACAPKSNASYTAIDAALKDVEVGRTQSVPRHLRDAHTSGAKKLGNGEGYLYPHSFEGHVVEQDYLEEKRSYYKPSNQGYEQIIQQRFEQWELKKKKNKSEKKSKSDLKS